MMKTTPFEPHSTYCRTAVTLSIILTTPACTEGNTDIDMMSSSSASSDPETPTSGASAPSNPTVDPDESGPGPDSSPGSSGVGNPNADSSSTGEYPNPEQAPPNILLIIADDYGVGSSSCYDIGTDFAPTPNIQALCDRGVTFTNAWSAPTCTPTRATTLTGRYPYRTGLGHAIGPGNPVGLSLDELIIPEALDLDPALGYTHACVGKWHVAGSADPNHPNLSGFEHYSGVLTGAVPDYFNWSKTVDGRTSTVDRYVTSEHIDDAIAWLDGRSDPWFLWLALVAPHSPLHLPPADLHSYDALSGSPADINANPTAYYRAMVGAMDTEIGRLLATLPPSTLDNTYVIFVGDNGPDNRVVEPPYVQQRAKGSLYQGGVNIPLIIAGPNIAAAGQYSDELAHVADLYPTILELASVSPEILPADLEIDGISLAPILADPNAESPHSWILTELFGGMADMSRQGRTARDERFKLIEFADGNEVFFDLLADPYEQNNLLTQPLSPEAMTSRDTLHMILDQNQ